MTYEQMQCLLRYLGYYKGNIDGAYGPKSEQAAREFQDEYGLIIDGKVGAETQKALKHAVAYGMPMRKEEKTDWWDEIEYFDRVEFKCKCGGKYCNGYPTEMQKKVVKVAERARKHFGATCVVTSGLRCEKWNQIQGGVENSRHKSGKAIDCRIAGVSGNKLLEYVKQQSEVRYAYVIEGDYVHFDIA